MTEQNFKKNLLDISKLAEEICKISSTISGTENIKCIRYCNACKYYGKMLKNVGKCYRTQLETLSKDWCSRFETRPETLCWECKNATLGCEWSSEFKPVEGWNAIPSVIDNETESYLVLECPKFERG